MSGDDRHFDLPYRPSKKGKCTIALIVGVLLLIWGFRHWVIGPGYRWSCGGCGATVHRKVMANQRALPLHPHTWEPAGGPCGCPPYFPCPFNLGEHDVEPVLRGIKEDRLRVLLPWSQPASDRFDERRWPRFVREGPEGMVLSVGGSASQGSGTIEVVFDERLIPVRGHLLSEDGGKIDLRFDQAHRDLAKNRPTCWWAGDQP
jgi:hypothetical protein